MVETGKPTKKFKKITEKETILLGLIAEEPIHAYGLEEKIRHRRMNEWTEIGFSSIYRVLTGLEDNGLIETRLEHVGQGATRKVHEINNKGKQALAIGVLNSLSDLKPLKNPFAVGLANITQAPFEEVIKTLKERASSIAALESELSSLKRLHTDELKQGGEDEINRRGLLAVKLIFDHANRHLQAEREFLEDAIRMLNREGGKVFSEDA